MMSLSAVIIAKNEEEMIADCLDHLQFCDEVIVIDGKSEDKTVEIAKKMGAIVYQQPFTDFATARNFGLEKANGAWILYIDADERVSPALQDSIKYAVSSSKYDETAAYKIQRKNFYFGNHEWPDIEKLERLFKKEKLKGWYGMLHESPKVDGRIDVLGGFLMHYTHRDLHAMLEKTIVWSTTEAKLRYDASHPNMTWWRFPRVMISSFFQSYIIDKGYKAGTAGLVESIYQSFSMFITYAKLWEKQQGGK